MEVIKEKNDKELRKFEQALNTFFTQLYTDVKAAKYVFIKNKDYYYYELYLTKKINGAIVDVPMSKESTGTRKLLELFPFLFSAVLKYTILVDEMDSGIHDLLMIEVMNAILESMDGQFIATTHNTMLMNNIPRENVYIICSDADANKEIVPLNKYEVRVQKSHNVQRKYLAGDFGGIPFVGNVDFKELVHETIDNISILVNDDEDNTPISFKIL